MLKEQVGKTAGQVWKYLGKNGRTTFNTLQNEFSGKVDNSLIYQAIGWLAREDKINFMPDNKETYVALTENEMKIYQRENTDQTAKTPRPMERQVWGGQAQRGPGASAAKKRGM